MAGSVARLVKWLYSTPLGIVNLVSGAALPVSGYVLVQKKKELAQIREQQKLITEEFHALRARGIIIVQE